MHKAVAGNPAAVVLSHDSRKKTLCPGEYSAEDRDRSEERDFRLVCNLLVITIIH